MNRKQLLLERREGLRRCLEETDKELREIELFEIRDEFGLYHGCIVDLRGTQYRVTRIGTRYGKMKPSIYGHKRTKNGWHSRETYIGDSAVVVEEAKQ